MYYICVLYIHICRVHIHMYYMCVPYIHMCVYIYIFFPNTVSNIYKS